MADILTDTIRRILLSSRTGTSLTSEQIADLINEQEETSVGEPKVPVTALGVARGLLDYIENQSAPQLEVTVNVKLKKPQATFSIAGQRASKRAMLEYMKLEKRYAKGTQGTGKKAEAQQTPGSG